MRFFALLIALVWLSLASYSQPIAGYGCLSKSSGNPSPIVNNSVYQTYTNTRANLPAYRSWSTNYSNRTIDEVNYPCWIWTTLSTNGCYLKRQNGMTNTASNYVLGDYGSFSGSNGTLCLPLDDYTIPLIALVGAFAYFHLRRKNTSSFI